VPFVGVGIAPRNIPVIEGHADSFRILVLLAAPYGDVSGYAWTQGKLLRVLRRVGLRRELAVAKSAAEVVRILQESPDGGAGRDVRLAGTVPAASSGSEACDSPGPGKEAS
jgi:hypothetical protein